MAHSTTFLSLQPTTSSAGRLCAGELFFIQHESRKDSPGRTDVRLLFVTFQSFSPACVIRMAFLPEWAFVETSILPLPDSRSHQFHSTKVRFSLTSSKPGSFT